MTTGGRVSRGRARKWLVPPSVFESKEDAPHFVDVAGAAGFKLFSMAGGVIVDDFEGNGVLDVVTSSMYVCEHMHYFHNNGDGTFSDRSEQAGLMDQLGGLNMIQADYDNDDAWIFWCCAAAGRSQCASRSYAATATALSLM